MPGRNKTPGSQSQSLRRVPKTPGAQRDTHMIIFRDRFSDYQAAGVAEKCSPQALNVLPFPMLVVLGKDV
ncbi:unnamed protein product [Litomosoides sigmodontis]|uniref:Uncharacterized protein n=1 Tax=Litomosoides sigmodontis TaxID=42156 RepID=A0A3P6V8L6_LITSI|nr:unnamed protein product [Litomosoides sigmodontis]